MAANPKAFHLSETELRVLHYLPAAETGNRIVLYGGPDCDAAKALVRLGLATAEPGRYWIDDFARTPAGDAEVERMAMESTSTTRIGEE